MWGALICGLTPCTPLPAKGYKETASVKELLANLISRKGILLEHVICVLLTEGALL